MKVLHLSTSDVRGGAARGAYWLHQSLQELGVCSRMLVGRKHSCDPSVEELGGIVSGAGEKLRSVLDQLPLYGYHKTNEAFWTVGWQPRHVTRAVERYRPDLIHIHWTGGGFLPIRALSQISVPIVWTMRDMWAFTGGCHYTSGCNRYRLRCGRCPQLNSHRENDLSRQVWNNKRASWRHVDLWVVTISQWLADCARQSELFAETPITVIPNGVDVERFRPQPRAESRARLGLEPDRNYILYGALGALTDERKGFKQLVAALRRFETLPQASNTELVVFGDVGGAAMSPLEIPTRFVGTIDDDERLAGLYAAADIMVAPSLQEAFGKTLIEAMACGTPVVAFDNGGPAEIIDHRVNGYLAAAFEPEALAHGVAWCLESPDRSASLGHTARRKVEAEYDASIIGQRYLDHYRQILARPA